jgi:5-(carboxyamino)imidazole ribonucleotide mutase
VPEVVIILGSPSDRDWSDRISSALERLSVPSRTRIASAHKTPARLLELLSQMERDGEQRVYITVAGRSNALSGFVDASVGAPVIACPPPSDSFAGLDILSSLRMPSGVAPLVVLEPDNAALAAAKILAVSDSTLRRQIEAAQESGRRRVLDADEATNGADALEGSRP